MTWRPGISGTAAIACVLFLQDQSRSHKTCRQGVRHHWLNRWVQPPKKFNEGKPDMATKSNPIVLIHGLWMTARCWENWTKRYTDKGHRVIAKSWPGMDIDINELRRDPSPIANLGITEVVAHYETLIRELDSPPIIVGHSFGGLITQILLDRGLGAAGVAIAPAPVKGILFLPFSTLKVSFPALIIALCLSRLSNSTMPSRII